MLRSRIATGRFLGTAFIALELFAIFAANASAGPYWAFNGTTLSGTETVAGEATQSSLTFPGLTTKCTIAPYEMEIWNTGTNGIVELTSLSFNGCATDSASCTVTSVTINALPWPLHLTKVATDNYVILEHVNVTILYAGEECALAETPIPVTGTAGGSFDNVTSEATFNSTTFA